MTNDVFQNRVLALADLNRLPEDLAAHLHTHPELRGWVNQVRQLNRLIAELPVPNADKARLSFVDSLTADGPVIKSIPQLQRRPLFTLKGLLQKVNTRVAAGLAAAALVGVGLWAFSGKTKPVPDVASGPRHELLAKSSTFVAEMAKAKTPQAKLLAGAQLSKELTTEVADLYNVAKAEDLNKLAEVYEKVLARGVTEPANNLPRSLPAKERHELLSSIRDQLANTVAEAMAKNAQARKEAHLPLNRIIVAARSAQIKVQTMIDGGA